MSQFSFYPPSGAGGGAGGITQSQVQAAVTAALAATFPLATIQERYMDTSSTAINGSGGAWVNLGGATLTPASIKGVEGTLTIGIPVQVGYGANAGAVTQAFVLNQGDGPFKFPIQIPAGTQLWVRSLSATGATTGYVTLNILG